MPLHLKILTFQAVLGGCRSICPRFLVAGLHSVYAPFVARKPFHVFRSAPHPLPRKKITISKITSLRNPQPCRVPSVLRLMLHHRPLFSLTIRRIRPAIAFEKLRKNVAPTSGVRLSVGLMFKGLAMKMGCGASIKCFNCIPLFLKTF